MVYLGGPNNSNSPNNSNNSSNNHKNNGSSGTTSGSTSGSASNNSNRPSHHLHLQQRAPSTSSSGLDRPPTNNPDSSGEDDSDEREGRIRVGKDYQVGTPNLIPISQRKPEQTPERALLVWSPSPTISTAKLDEYIQISKEKYGYNAEQALGMLFWHKHDLDRAIQDLANFTPFPDEWSVEDKVLFEQAFQFHGKSFHRIRRMLPDKTIAQLVKYYYGWKKTRTRTSLMDRQARKLQVQREEQGNYGEDLASSSNVEKTPATSAAAAGAGGANASAVAEEDSETEEDKELARKPKCFNCGILCHVTHPTPKGQMCGTCHQYFTRTGNVRPTSAPVRKDGTKSKHSLFKNNNKPPKGMYVNHDDLVALATGPQSQGDALLKSMDREIVSYKRVVQNNKQFLSTLQKKVRDRSAVDPYKIPDAEAALNARWSNEDLLLGVQGIRKFGKNFKVIAEIIGTKTESHVRSFFVNYRRRYNLDAALKEYEAEHGPSVDQDEDKNPTEEEMEHQDNGQDENDGQEEEENGSKSEKDIEPEKNKKSANANNSESSSEKQRNGQTV